MNVYLAIIVSGVVRGAGLGGNVHVGRVFDRQILCGIHLILVDVRFIVLSFRRLPNPVGLLLTRLKLNFRSLLIPVAVPVIISLR